MIKPDKWIIKMSQQYKMIEPFAKEQVKEGVISYGVSSYGYDMRISDEFKVFTPNGAAAIDPKNFNSGIFKDIKADGFLLLPPHSYALGKSVEYFKIPRNVITACFGKSTYARCGLVINVTPFEPEWEGFVTISISNTSSLPVKIYCNEGIAQVLFFESDEICDISYSDRKGKYQVQKHITHAKI
ncbi:MAG: dCTP deaminase [Elusimicrobia bacterium]|nr:dCTP deaminase [Elusimicrobiota bacterium]